MAAVEQHRPGQFDAHAGRIASWTSDQVAALLADIRSRLRSPGGIRLARRGALLHADIARFGGWGGSAAWADAQAQPSAPNAPSPVIVLSRDGRSEGYGAIAGHWSFARFLLDSIRRDLSQDPMAAFWYQGAAAHLLSVRAFGDLEFHLLDARRVLPRDAGIRFYSGVLHEVFASPTAQGVRESANLPRGSRFLIESPERELREAEAYLRRALDLEPDRLEARLRLGRVLEQLEQPGRAVAELRRVAANTDDNLLLYYARLFLGSAEEALGHIDAAREFYEGAAALYPGAQSAPLALAQLMRHSGDRSSAVRAILAVVTPGGAGDRASSDPWWQYATAPGRHAGVLFEQAARACEEAERR